MNNTDYRPHTRTHIVVGMVIIIVGLIMLMSAMDLIPERIHEFFFRWQFILILIGAIAIFTNQNKVPGLVLIFIGTFFLAPEYFKDFKHYFIPVALILIGLAIMLRGHGKRSRGFVMEDYSSSDPDVIDVVAIFSGGERLVTTKNFRGGKITAVFGGAEVNFLNSELAPQEVFIEATAVFGGIVIILPPEWEVIIDVDQIFGGFADKRYFPPNHVFDPNKKLYLKGAVVFGGGEIKNHK